MRYELGFYILEDGILHSHRRENLISYTAIYSLEEFYSFVPPSLSLVYLLCRASLCPYFENVQVHDFDLLVLVACIM
jgi:hypothetical protein